MRRTGGGTSRVVEMMLEATIRQWSAQTGWAVRSIPPRLDF
jgi:hypothetical protein